MKKVKTRKDRVCPYCARVIPAGTLCSFAEGKQYVYDKDYHQASIKYWKVWMCLPTDDECKEVWGDIT